MGFPKDTSWSPLSDSYRQKTRDWFAVRDQFRNYLLPVTVRQVGSDGKSTFVTKLKESYIHVDPQTRVWSNITREEYERQLESTRK